MDLWHFHSIFCELPFEQRNWNKNIPQRYTYLFNTKEPKWMFPSFISQKKNPQTNARTWIIPFQSFQCIPLKLLRMNPETWKDVLTQLCNVAAVAKNWHWFLQSCKLESFAAGLIKTSKGSGADPWFFLLHSPFCQLSVFHYHLLAKPRLCFQAPRSVFVHIISEHREAHEFAPDGYLHESCIRL